MANKAMNHPPEIKAESIKRAIQQAETNLKRDSASSNFTYANKQYERGNAERDVK